MHQVWPQGLTTLPLSPAGDSLRVFSSADQVNTSEQSPRVNTLGQVTDRPPPRPDAWSLLKGSPDLGVYSVNTPPNGLGRAGGGAQGPAWLLEL